MILHDVLCAECKSPCESMNEYWHRVEDCACSRIAELQTLCAELARLRALIENAKRETQGWTTGGYPEPFMRLAAQLYHALDAGRGEGTK